MENFYLKCFLSDLSSGEIANIIEQLDAGDRKKLIFFLGSSIEPEIILELDKEIRNEIISVVGEHTFLDVVSKLDTDDLIVVLEELGRGNTSKSITDELIIESLKTIS